MTGSIFAESHESPGNATLLEALGAAKAHWDALITRIEERCDGLRSEWKHYGKKHGWQLKFTYRRRALLWMIQHDGSFLAGMSLREAGVVALRETGLPKDFIEKVESEKPYREGWPARVEVTGPEEVSMVETLLEVKLRT